MIIISSIPTIEFFFSANQLLWINLIIESLNSIAIASCKPNYNEVLSKKPYKIKSRLITKSMLVKISVQCCLQVSIIIFLIFFGPQIFNCLDDRGYTYQKFSKIQGSHTTIVYNVFIMMQIVNAFLSRSLDNQDLSVIFSNLSENKIFIGIQFFIFICQINIIQFGHMLIMKTLYLG